MATVNMLEAKTNLSRLVESVESGREAEVVIARNGKPAARLVPIEPPRKKVKIGLAKGKYGPAPTLEEWNALDADVLAMFEESMEKRLD